MDTFRTIKHHVDADLLPERLFSRDEVVEILGGPDNQNVVTLDKWDKVRDFEISEGQKAGKLKEKVLQKDEMLKIANS